ICACSRDRSLYYYGSGHPCALSSCPTRRSSDLVKKYRGKISYILVYSLERFSRNDNSIWLTNELRRLGIEIVSVTQPIDTSNASGQMQQKMLFLFGEFDNQLRRQKCMAGTREMILRRGWPTQP